MAKIEENFDELGQSVLDHYWMPYTQYEDQSAAGGPKFIVDADGIRMTDSDGNTYIDGMAGLALVNVGHGRSEIAEAVAEQLNHVHYANTFVYGSVPVAKLADKLADLAPGDLSRVFLASGGSEAVDTALKIARQYHVNNGEPQRTKIISRRGSYHGVSIGALSVNTAPVVQRKVWEPLLAPMRAVGPDPEEVADLVNFEGPDTFAAFITEPISFSRGVEVPDDSYWPRMREICNEHGIIMIADEVINGFGRTGKMFAMEHWGVIPDMMTFAKGVTSGYMPVGGVIASPKVYDAFKGDATQTFTHGYTYSGHPAGAAAALANLDILERENLVDNAAEVGDYLIGQLGTLKEHSMVKEIHGIGLLTAVHLTKDKATGEPLDKTDPRVKSLDEKLMSKGLLTRSFPNISLAPPLNITKEEVDEMVGIIDEALTEVESGK